MAYKPFILGLTEGGTNASLTASNGGILYSTASAVSILAGTATANQPLMSGASSAPAWSTATYPSTTTANSLLYSSATNVVGQVTPFANRVLCSSASSVPQFQNTLPFLSATVASLAAGTLTCTDSGSTYATFDLFRSGGSPANADNIFALTFSSQDSGIVSQEYARIGARIVTVTAGSENGALDFYTVSSAVSTLQMSLLNTGGQYRGNNTNTAPPAGYIGELAISANTSGQALTNNTLAQISSLTLTPGNWDVCGSVLFYPSGVIAGPVFFRGIVSATTASNVPIDDQGGNIGLGLCEIGGNNIGLTIGAHPYPTTLMGPCRVSISTNTTYYLNAVGQATTTWNVTAFGAIRAVRVG